MADTKLLLVDEMLASMRDFHRLIAAVSDENKMHPKSWIIAVNDETV